MERKRVLRPTLARSHPLACAHIAQGALNAGDLLSDLEGGGAMIEVTGSLRMAERQNPLDMPGRSP